MLDGLPIFLLALILMPGYVLIRRRMNVAPSRIWFEVAVGLYLVLLAAVVFLPFRIDSRLRADDAVWDRAAFLARSVNLMPLASIRFTLAHPQRLGAWAQIGGNLLLLSPLGALVPLRLPPMRHLGRMVVLAATCAVAIEATQLLLFWIRLSIRAIDIDDVILNVIGVLVGYGIWCAWTRLSRPRLTSASA